MVSSACNAPLKLPKLLEDVRLKWEIADGPRTPDIFRQPPDPTEFEQLNEALSRCLSRGSEVERTLLGGRYCQVASQTSRRSSGATLFYL